LEPQYTKELYRKAQCFLLTTQMDGQTRQNRRLVAKRRLIPGVIMGKFGIPHLDETIRKFPQKRYRRYTNKSQLIPH
jgi:hypothetical protein